MKLNFWYQNLCREIKRLPQKFGHMAQHLNSWQTIFVLHLATTGSDFKSDKILKRCVPGKWVDPSLNPIGGGPRGCGHGWGKGWGRLPSCCVYAFHVGALCMRITSSWGLNEISIDFYAGKRKHLEIRRVYQPPVSVNTVADYCGHQNESESYFFTSHVW